MHSTPLGLPFRRQLDAFERDLKHIEEGDGEAVHRTRVASRRLRELIPLLALDRDVARHLGRRLRAVTKRLGAVRELDVLVLLIAELTEKIPHAATALKQLAVTAVLARVAARERLSAKLPTAKLERLARKLERVSQRLASNEDAAAPEPVPGRGRAGLWALDARMARRAAAVVAAIDAAATLYTPEQLHDVRIAVKKLRYAAELTGDATNRPIAADLAALRRAQDVLGRLHDLHVLMVRARETQASSPHPDLTVWRSVGELVQVVEGDCRQLHARYVGDRTELRAIAKRLGAVRRRTPMARRATA